MNTKEYIPLVVNQVKNQLVGEQPDPNEVLALCVRAAVNALPHTEREPEGAGTPVPPWLADIFSKYHPGEQTDDGVPRRFYRAADELWLEAWRQLYKDGCFAIRHDWIDEALLKEVSVEPGMPTDISEISRMPRRAKFIGSSEWSWSCAHSREEEYYLSRDQYFTRWRLYVVFPSWKSDYMDVPHHVPARAPYDGVSPKKAAMHLLAAYFDLLRHEEFVDSGCAFYPGDVIDHSDIDLIKNYVWPNDPPAPTLGQDRINALLVEAYHERLRSGA